MKAAPRPRRPHDPEATREALVSAAAELFAEHGYDGVGVDAIARRAGANKALINYHFGGKAGLYRAILKSTFEGLAEELRSARDPQRPADEALREFVAAVGAMVRRRPSLPRMVLREVLSGGEQLTDELLPHFLAVFDTVRGIVARGVATGRFRPVDPVLTHLGLIGSLMFFFATTRFRERKLGRVHPPVAQPRAEDFLAHVQELMVRGLRASKARPRAGR
jgi:AcrR family transcriptional regulator